MKKLIALCVGMALILTLAGVVYAANQEDKKGKAASNEDRLTGRVQNINKAGSEFELRVSGGVVRKVGWTSATKWTFRNAPDSIDNLKDGLRVACLGKFEGVKLIATRVDLREK